MKDLVWDETLSVQVAEVDDDHRRLVDVFNVLNHAVSEGESEEYVKAVMDELLSCTVWHFKHEERLMLKYGYEDLPAHKKEHEELMASAKALQDKLLQKDASLANEDIVTLEHWLTGHIFGVDMDMGAYLCKAM